MTAAIHSERTLRRRGRANRTGWLLTLPSLTVMILLTIIPLGSVIVGAISRDGWDRLSQLISTPGFTLTLRNTAIWVIFGTVGSIAVGMAAALALQHPSVRFVGLWRSLLLIPWITPTVVAATAWKWFYSRDYGHLNAILLELGLIETPVSWLTNTSIAIYAVALVHVWATFSFVMLMISAGLQAIPVELYEAARVDGANALRQFWNITLPGVRDIVFIVTLIVTVWTLNSFLPVWIMTKGGPAGSTNIIPVQLYQYFLLGDRTAIYVLAAFQLLFSVAIAVLYIRQSRRDVR